MLWIVQTDDHATHQKAVSLELQKIQTARSTYSRNAHTNTEERVHVGRS